MTQEEKELLLQDLSARLLFGVKIKIGEHSDYKLIGIVITDEYPIKVEVTENGIPYKIEVSPDIIKPYLRPMSSMTEDELIQYKCRNDALDENYEVHIDNAYPAFDWLNSHHFDYRNLIEKGLALEAPEGMYNLKKK